MKLKERDWESRGRDLTASMRSVKTLALTLTLSPWRGNQHRQRGEKPLPHELFPALETILPLPGGEGRGEGECEFHPLSRAFTLIELLVVVLLIGITTAMIIPQMRGSYEDAQLRSASRDLVSVFNLASSRAVSLNEQHRVRLDPVKGRYRIERKARESEIGAGFIPAREISGGEGAIDTHIHVMMQPHGGDLETEPDRSVAPGSPDDTSAPAPDPTITFYPDGTADKMEILLEDRAGFRRVLRVNPVTAGVQVAEMERK